jgi:hypothetical protein
VKKKYLKTYEGVIPSYGINTGSEVVEVREEKIQISLTQDSLYIKIGKLISGGIYEASKEEKNQYTITGTMEISGIPELLYVNTKSKSLLFFSIQSYVFGLMAFGSNSQAILRLTPTDLYTSNKQLSVIKHVLLTNTLSVIHSTCLFTDL